MVTVLLDGQSIRKFQVDLPNLLTPGLFIDVRKGGSYDISMSQGTHDFGLINSVTGQSYAPTSAWGYHSPSASLWDSLGLNYLGPTIVAQKRAPISVNWYNRLPSGTAYPFQPGFQVDTTLHGAMESTTGGVNVQPHLHGGITQDIFDGNPFANSAFLGNKTFTYLNGEDAANIWYHDHALGITRLNVYAGLAGFYIQRDDYDTGNPNNPLGLPANYDFGTPSLADDQYYEFPIVFQDKAFTSTGKLYYPSTVGDPLPGPKNATVPPSPGIPSGTTNVPEFAGDTLIVNGKAWPKLNVEAKAYRFRLLNGSDSRFYEFTLPGGLEFQVIGTDNGLLDGAAVPVSRLRMAPGERYDVIIDFSKQAGKTLTLNNVAGGQGTMPIFNDPQTTGQVMQFIVNKTLTPGTGIPANPQWKTDLRRTTGPNGDANNFIPVWTYNATTGRWDARHPDTGPQGPVLYSSTVVDPTKPGYQDHNLAVFEGLDPYGRIFPHLGTVKEGSLLWDMGNQSSSNPTFNGVQAAAAETVTGVGGFESIDDYVVFQIYNTTPDAHPIHLHGNEFQILQRQKIKVNLLPKTITKTDPMTGLETYQGWTFADTNQDGVTDSRDITLQGKPSPAAAYERGFKDTAIVDPGEVITVVTRFDPKVLSTDYNGDGFLDGKFVWHCHILSHEDHEMMRPMFLTAAPNVTTPIG